MALYILTTTKQLEVGLGTRKLAAWYTVNCPEL